MSDKHWPLVVFALLGLFAACELRPLSPTPAPSATATPPAPTVLPTVAAQCQYRYHGEDALPDLRCTPGATDPYVTQANIQQTICKSGYTTGVRPSVDYTEPLKLAQMRQYGQFSASGVLFKPSGYEEDHLIPLELGGAPTDIRNLWPEPGATPNAKDAVENRVRGLVCSGKMALDQAQGFIASDWTILK